jgi:hypothetical protein
LDEAQELLEIPPIGRDTAAGLPALLVLVATELLNQFGQSVSASTRERQFKYTPRRGIW